MKHKIKFIKISFLTLFIMSYNSFASFEYGGLRDIGARASGMGGAYLSVGSDADMVYWNPACLAKNNVFKQFSLYYTTLISNVIPQGFISYSSPERGKGSVSISAMLFGNSGFYSEEIYSLSYAKLLTKKKELKLSAGVNLKYMLKSFVDNFDKINSTSKIGYDLGSNLTKKINDNELSLSIVQRGYLSGQEDADTSYTRIGMSYPIEYTSNQKLTLSCDYDLTNKGIFVGSEIDIFKNILIGRLGYSQFGEDIPTTYYSFGFSIFYFPWRIDYAVVLPQSFSSDLIHKFSLDIKF